MELKESSKKVLYQVKENLSKNISIEELIEVKKTQIDRVKEIISSLTEKDNFLFYLSKTYKEGEEERLSHSVVLNNFKKGDNETCLQEFKKLIDQS
jgi:N-glycosylase/DNA lyase